MSDKILSNEERQLCWREAEWLSKYIDFEPPTTEERIDEILDALPKRQPGESIEAWLRRYSKPVKNKSAVIIPFPNPLFLPVTEFIRRAASSSVERFPLPENDYLESADGSFRLKIVKNDETLIIFIEALGLAIDKFANTFVGLSPNNNLEDLIAVVELNDDAEGECILPDTEEVRRVLLNPIIGSIRNA